MNNALKNKHKKIKKTLLILQYSASKIMPGIWNNLHDWPSNVFESSQLNGLHVGDLLKRTWASLDFGLQEVPEPIPCRRGGNTVLHRKNMTPFPITRMAFSITTVENFSANMLNEGFPGGSVVKNLFVNVEDTGEAGSIPGWRRSLGEGNGNPLQDSCLENFTDRGAWQAKVHEVAKRGMWLSMHAYTNHMLNEIPQGKNYLWDFLSLFPSLLKYQSTTISSRTLWSTLQQMLAPSSNIPAPTVMPKGLSSSLWSLLGESP